MGFQKVFKTSGDLEVNGVKFMVDEKRWVKLARMGGRNVAYTKLLTKRLKALNLSNVKKLRDATAKAVIAYCIAHTCVKGWGGDADLDTTPATPETAIAMFAEMDDFFIFCRQCADNGDFFMPPEEDDDEDDDDVQSEPTAAQVLAFEPARGSVAFAEATM